MSFIKKKGEGDEFICGFHMHVRGENYISKASKFTLYKRREKRVYIIHLLELVKGQHFIYVSYFVLFYFF